MNPNEQVPEENVEAEAAVEVAIDSNEKLGDIAVSNDVAAEKLDEIEQNTEAQIVQSVENTEQMVQAIKPNLETLAKTSALVQQLLTKLQGPKGDTGETGPQGEKGATGEQGPAGSDAEKVGPKGDTGPRGPAGVRGESGAVGKIGPRGEIGPAGKDGVDGEQGPKGEDGVTPTNEEVKSLIDSTFEESRPDFMNAIRNGIASRDYNLAELKDVDISGLSKNSEGVYDLTQVVGGDMSKSIYDTDNNGVIDSAEKVEGVDAAGSNTFYGKNSGGSIGFHTVPSGGGGGGDENDPLAESFTGFTTTSITLSQTPATNGNFMLFRNGVLLADPGDYSKSGTAVTLVTAAETDDVYQAVYEYGSGTPAEDPQTDSFTGSATTTLTLSQTPGVTEITKVFRNGILMLITTDYTISGTTVTLTTASETDDLYQVIYKY